MNRVHELFDAYVENDLSRYEGEQLCACLRESDAAVKDFVRESYLHSQLFVIARRRALHHDVMATPPAGDPLLTIREASAATGSRIPRRRRAVYPAALTLAAAAVIAMVIFWAANRPQAVAQLTQTSADVRWESNTQFRGGTLLHRGEELRLARGRVLATMVSGARVVLEGPAVLRIEDDNRVRLESGRLGATVPPEATGFVVATQLGDFVDLGTEFMLDLSAESQCALYVFSGLVEVRPADRSTENPPFKVPQTRAIRYDAVTGEAKLIPFTHDRKLGM